MVVRPWIMPYAVVNFLVWVSCTFGAEFPDGPLGAMFLIKEFDELVGRVTVGALGVGGGGT